MTTESEYQTGIVGAGWLGLPLARTLQAEGREVAVTVSSAQKAAQLTAEGLQAWPLQLGTGLTALPFRCRELVICVPPSKVEDYPAAIGRVAELAQAAGVQRLLFVSATSVWAPGQEEDEHPMPAHERGMRMLASEQAAMGAGIPCAMVLRPAGLYGPQRHPGRFLAGKTLEGGGQAVNLVHLDDVVAACQLLLAQGKDGDAYNLSAPVHPRREQFYPFAARQLGLPAPVFIEPAGRFVPVEGLRICEHLGFVYRWPDPAHWFAELAARGH
ncbi:NAD-dependent epimerase/dehydratase family protein [Aeromonas hydrophila]|uniref:NAD-dependent epimerase/dehydratase family protein n=1 Tax=Aeromonas hydrophila TaxID=644 RepID=UPI002F41DF0C